MQKQKDPVDTELLPQALSFVQQCVDDFERTLVMQAQTLARRRGEDVATRKDVADALSYVKEHEANTWGRRLATIVGSSLLGIFGGGFIRELSTGSSSMLLITLYVLCGFLGMFLVFWGLRR